MSFSRTGRAETGVPIYLSSAAASLSTHRKPSQRGIWLVTHIISARPKTSPSAKIFSWLAAAYTENSEGSAGKVSPDASQDTVVRSSRGFRPGYR